jgi:hypothetical protein
VVSEELQAGVRSLMVKHKGRIRWKGSIKGVGEQIKSSPLTSNTHSFALRANPTPREEESVRADQELTNDLP